MRRGIIMLGLLCLVGLSAWAQGTRVRIEGRGGASLYRESSGYRLGDTPLGLGASGAVEFAQGTLLYTAMGVNWRKVKYQSGGNTSAITSLEEQDIRIPIHLGLRLQLLSVGVSVEGGVWGGYTLEHNISVLSPDMIMDGLKEGYHQVGKLTMTDLQQDLSHIGDKRLSYGIGGSVALEFSLLYLRCGVEHRLSKRSGVAIESPLWGFAGLGFRF